MWEVGTYKIRELVEMVGRQELGLPEFQRPFVWTKTNWLPFVSTILLARPTGTLLLLEVDEKTPSFAPIELETAPPLADPPANLRWLLLDGQQRLTTLYRATRSHFGKAPNLRRMIVDVRSAMERGYLTESDVSVERSGQIVEPTGMAEKGQVSVDTLLDAGAFDSWKQAYVRKFHGNDFNDFAEKRLAAIPGLDRMSDYEFPVLKLRANTPIEVVADIFEGMNRRGQPLNKFDLMVARLYRPSGDGTRFNLRRVWESELAKAPALSDVGIDVDDGMFPLQLSAQVVSRQHPTLRGRVNDLNSVLELPPEMFTDTDHPLARMAGFAPAVDAFERAAAFLRDSCGVVTGSLLPQKAMLLPIADQFLREIGGDRRLSDVQLKRWFFITSLRGDYYGSVNFYASRDCERLQKWADDAQPNTMPDWLEADLNRSFIEGLDLSQEFLREGTIPGKALMSILVAQGARDWGRGDGGALLNLGGLIDIHHIVPEARLRQFGLSAGALRPIDGLTPLRSDTNKAIGQLNPKDVFFGPNGQASTAVLEGHGIDAGLLASAYDDRESFNEFRADRSRRLKEIICQALGI